MSGFVAKETVFEAEYDSQEASERSEESPTFICMEELSEAEREITAGVVVALTKTEVETGIVVSMTNSAD